MAEKNTDPFILKKSTESFESSKYSTSGSFSFGAACALALEGAAIGAFSLGGLKFDPAIWLLDWFKDDSPPIKALWFWINSPNSLSRFDSSLARRKSLQYQPSFLREVQSEHQEQKQLNTEHQYENVARHKDVRRIASGNRSAYSGKETRSKAKDGQVVDHQVQNRNLGIAISFLHDPKWNAESALAPRPETVHELSNEYNEYGWSHREDHGLHYPVEWFSRLLVARNVVLLYEQRRLESKVVNQAQEVVHFDESIVLIH